MDGEYKCRAVAERLNGKEEISKQFIKYIIEEEMRTRSHNSINGHNASPPTQSFPLKKGTSDLNPWIKRYANHNHSLKKNLDYVNVRLLLEMGCVI